MHITTVAVHKVIRGFKIRKKADIKTLMESVMYRNNSYRINAGEENLTISRSKDNEYSFCLINDTGIIDINMEIANSNNKSYDLTFEDAVWKYRKHINNYFCKEE